MSWGVNKYLWTNRKFEEANKRGKNRAILGQFCANHSSYTSNSLCRLNQNHEEAAVEVEEEVEVVKLMLIVTRKKKVKKRKTVHLLRNQRADQGLHPSSPQDTVRCI